MWIVQVVLRRRYTFILRSTPAGVFLKIDIPVVAIMQSYGGLSAQEMKDRVTVQIERNPANSVSVVKKAEEKTYSSSASGPGTYSSKSPG